MNRLFILVVIANMLAGLLCILWSVPTADKLLCSIGLLIIGFNVYRVVRRDTYYLEFGVKK